MKYFMFTVFFMFISGCASEREYLLQTSSDHWEVTISVEELPAEEEIGEDVFIQATYLNEEHTADNVILTSLSSELNQNEMSTSAVSGIDSGDTVEQERRGSAQNPPFLGSITNEQPITLIIDWHQDGESMQQTITFEVE